MYNKKKVSIKPDSDNFKAQFKDDDTRFTEDHLAVACREDLRMWQMLLWSVWLMQAYDGVDGPDEGQLGELANRWFDLQAKLKKAIEFAELAQYATGFEIPEHQTFRHIDIEALTTNTNEENQ